MPQEKCKQEGAILGAVFASVPHLAFMFMMFEVMLKEHQDAMQLIINKQKQQEQQQDNLQPLSAEEVANTLNEAGGEGGEEEMLENGM